MTQEELLASPDLAAILTYHVLPAQVMAADVRAESSPATVQGETVDVKPVDGGVTVNDATVATTDCGGVERHHPRHRQGAIAAHRRREAGRLTAPPGRAVAGG